MVGAVALLLLTPAQALGTLKSVVVVVVVNLPQQLTHQVVSLMPILFLGLIWPRTTVEQVRQVVRVAEVQDRQLWLALVAQVAVGVQEALLVAVVQAAVKLVGLIVAVRVAEPYQEIATSRG